MTTRKGAARLNAEPEGVGGILGVRRGRDTLDMT